MAFSGLDGHGNIHPCYTFFERTVSCVQKEIFPTKYCSEKALDYLECLNKKKLAVNNYKIALELRKMKILALPRYDEKTDTFIQDFVPLEKAFEAAN